MHQKSVSILPTDKQPRTTDKHLRLKQRLYSQKKSIFKKALLLGMKDGEKFFENFIVDLEAVLLEHEQLKKNLLYGLASSMVTEELTKTHTIVHMCERLLENNPMEISLHPADAAVVKSFKDSSNNCLWQKVTIIDNEQLAKGSLVIKTHNRIIEAHIADQINLGLELLGRKK